MTDPRQRIAETISVEDRGYSSPCWVWQGRSSKGYSRTSWHNREVGVHRLSYEVHVGPIGEGLVIDHLCRVPMCVNPRHLEPVTNGENIRRGNGPAVAAARMLAKTHCPKGHPLSGENLYRTRAGARACKECRRIDWRRRKADRVGVFARPGATSLSGGGAA